MHDALDQEQKRPSEHRSSSIKTPSEGTAGLRKSVDKAARRLLERRRNGQPQIQRSDLRGTLAGMLGRSGRRESESEQRSGGSAPSLE